MNALAHRARRTLGAAAVAIGLLLVTACDVKEELLQPQNPGVILPGSINSPQAADAVRIAAFGNLKTVTGGSESMWLLGGLMTDEWKSADTFSQRNETDQRTVQTNNSVTSGTYTSLQQARGHARDAITALLAYEPTPVSNIGQMYFAIGFEELTLAENYCNGIPVSYTVNGNPTYTDPLTTTAVYNLALAHFDSALTMTTAGDATTVALHQATLIAKARTLIELGKWSDAAALVSVTAVPTSLSVFADIRHHDAGQRLLSAEYQPGRLHRGRQRRRRRTHQERHSVRLIERSPAARAEQEGIGRGRRNGASSSNWSMARDDPVPLVSGIDARLTEAEAKLNANDVTGMMNILNALRTTSQTIGPYKVPVMAALPTPATQAQAIALFFRESAFWQFGRGYRLPNLRRLVRLYGYTQDQVFPTGTFFKGGVYGTDVNFPVFDTERTNPNFHGCIDRAA